MWYRRMPLEEWFDKYQFAARYNLGESSIYWLPLEDIQLKLSSIKPRYGHHKGDPELRKIISDQYRCLSEDDLLITNGASESIFCIYYALLCPGDKVIIEHPNYSSNYEVPRSLGCKVVLLKLRFEDRFKLDLDELESKVTDETKLVSLTHPNNPTGSMLSREELEKVVELIESKNCILLYDETYRDLAFTDKPPLAASLSPNVISISSMSKAYGLPGIRIGWLATQNKEVLESALAVREQVTICNSVIGEAIAKLILGKRQTILQNLKPYIERNLEVVAQWMEAHKEVVEWVRPEAGVVCLPRIRNDTSIDPEKLYRYLIERLKTFLIPGRCFEMDNHYFRLGFGGCYEELKGGLDNLGRALKFVMVV